MTTANGAVIPGFRLSSGGTCMIGEVREKLLSYWDLCKRLWLERTAMAVGWSLFEKRDVGDILAVPQNRGGKSQPRLSSVEEEAHAQSTA